MPSANRIPEPGPLYWMAELKALPRHSALCRVFPARVPSATGTVRSPCPAQLFKNQKWLDAHTVDD
jgi:hypothetical protein